MVRQTCRPAVEALESRFVLNHGGAGGSVSDLIPEQAVEIAPRLYYLGQAEHNGGQAAVEGYAFVTYRESHGVGPPSGGGDASQCFRLLAQGARWKTTEDYVVNPANGDGLPSKFVLDTIKASVATWEAEVPFDIFGRQLSTHDTLMADSVAPDGLNEVYFGDLDSGVIAVTTVWGRFRGPLSQRELVEWDMVLNDADFTFGDADTAKQDVMDLQNIVTHELGHAAGLDHPSNQCTEETMYRFASLNETKKRTLEAGDIAGVQMLYGSGGSVVPGGIAVTIPLTHQSGKVLDALAAAPTSDGGFTIDLIQPPRRRAMRV